MQVGLRAKTTSYAPTVKRKVDESTFKNLGHAGAVLRLIVRRSIRRRKRASSPGSPPHTQTGQLRTSIRYALEKERDTVVVGPSRSDIDVIGNVHEFGGSFRGRKYPARPFMKPGFEQIKKRLPSFWRDSIRS